jgi:hypothetical protein
MALQWPWPRLASLLAAVSLSGLGLRLTLAADSPAPRATDSPQTLRAEIARGASEVTAVTRQRWPRETVYRSIRQRLELNVQRHHDSDGFLVGAQLATLLWLEELPEDVTWREKALARHRDIASWLIPRLGLTHQDIAQTIVQATRLPPKAEQRLLDLLDIIEQMSPPRR